MTVKKKVFLVTTCIIIVAVLIVLCVDFFNGGQAIEFDGTLVQEAISSVF